MILFAHPKSVWRGRAVLIGATAFIGAIASLGYFQLWRGSYEASAVLKFEVGVTDFRRLGNVAISEAAFRRWQSEQQNIDLEAADALAEILAGTNSAQRNIAPFFRVTKRDLRDVPTVATQDEQQSHLLGIKLVFVARTPERATALVKLAGDYLRDIALWDALAEFVRSNQKTYTGRALQLEADLLRKSFAMQQLTGKLQELRSLSSRYPGSNRLGEQQLVTVGGEKNHVFLSPLMQLVGTESQIVELRRDMATVQRELRQARVAQTFFSRALERMGSSGAGVKLLRQLESVYSETAAEFNAESSDEVREIMKQIERFLSEYRITFVEQPPYLSGDRIAVSRPVGPGFATLIGALVGALIGIAVAMGPVLLAWLRSDTETSKEGV